MSTLHASAVLVGARAVLIQGPSGSGKSRLVLDLLAMPASPAVPFCRLVSDDRVVATAAHGRLLVAPPPALAGLIEMRGLGIRRVPYEPLAVAGLVLELDSADAVRLPEPATITILGVILPLLRLHPCADARSMLLAALRLRDTLVTAP